MFIGTNCGIKSTTTSSSTTDINKYKMNRFITLALVLIASVAIGRCSGYGAPTQYGSLPYGPSVQQVSLKSVANLGIESYLNGAQAAPVSGYSSYAPATSVVAAPAPSYQSAPSYNSAPSSYNSAPSSYNSAPSSYNSAPSAGYSAPTYSSQPISTAELYPGQQNYNAYQSVPQYSTLAVPVAASDAVAKLFVPQQKQYGSNNYAAPGNSYGLAGAGY